ncbi:MAG: protein kinase, partial [Myxococcota bacterium]
VMELVEGLPLSDLIDGPLDTGTTSFLARQLLGGLHALHEAVDTAGAPLRIVHRDIKPGNVLVARDGTVKLGDFGIARSVLESRTRTGFVRGSVAYLAPEQATQSQLDKRTDVYLAGLVLFEMLTGERYLQGERELDLLHTAQAPDWRAPSSLGADARWDSIVKKALARFPEERYRTAAAMARAIETRFESIDWGASPLAEKLAERPRPELKVVPPIATPRHSPMVARVAVSAALLLAATASAGWYLRGAQPTAEAALPPESQEMSRDAFALREAPSAEPSLPNVVPRVAPSVAPTAVPAIPEPELHRPRLAASERVRKPRAPSKQMAAQPARAETERVELENPEPPPAPGFDPRPTLEAAQRRLEARGLSTRDLTPELRAALEEFRCEQHRCEAATLELAARLDTVVLDRTLLERKLARVQTALDSATPPDAREREEWKRLSGLALHAVFDGKLSEANRLLNRLEALL